MYFKKRTTSSLKKYKKEKKYHSKLYKKERKAYFDKTNAKEVSDNKNFWKDIQPLFSENRKIRNKIALVDESENIISKEHLVSKELKSFLKMQLKVYK